MSDYTQETLLVLELARVRAERDALKAEYEKLVSYTQNGIECFASPCPEHSGVNTPPFSEFWERYGRLCLMCVVDERNALAAHVERLTACANAVYVANNVGNVAGFDKLLDAVDESPTASLTRLKAQWQAEALEKAMREVEQEPDLVKKGLIVAAIIQQLRRQAEEIVDG